MAYSEFKAGGGRTLALSDFAMSSSDEMSLYVKMGKDEGGGELHVRIPISLLRETLEFGDVYGCGCVRVGSVGDEKILITKSGSDDEYSIAFPIVSKDAAIVIGTDDYVEFVRRALDGKKRKANDSR